MVRTVPLRSRSLRMARRYVQRRRLVAEELAARPWCEIRLPVCTGRSVDLHERLSRGRGGSILDRANTVAGCRDCHSHVTENPALAEELGLSLSTPPRRR